MSGGGGWVEGRGDDAVFLEPIRVVGQPDNGSVVIRRPSVPTIHACTANNTARCVSQVRELWHASFSFSMLSPF